MSKEPELGQLVFGNPTGEYGTLEWQDALIDYLLKEIKRVYWNKNQKELENCGDCDLKGLELRAYWWGDEESEGAKKPNLKFNFSPQTIRWYKHPNRGQNCSLDWTDIEWLNWFERALKVIRKNEPKLF